MKNLTKAAIAAILALILFVSSCDKKKDDFTSSLTAVKFTSVKDTTIGIYTHIYVMYKYQNCWFKNPNTGAETVLVNKYNVYSNQDDKPMNKWLEYPGCFKYIQFKTFDVDSVPTSEEKWLYISQDSLHRI